MSDGRRSYWDQVLGQHGPGLSAFIRRRVRRAAAGSARSMQPICPLIRRWSPFARLRSRWIGRPGCRRFAELIETLPAKFQAVLVLQYRDGLSYQEIATKLGVTTHAVKKYVMQGLALCRKRLHRYEGGAR